MGRPVKKHAGGRPTKMTEITIGKLEEGFSYGFTDNEACLYAGIHPSTLYDYIQKNPEFSDKKERLKDNIKMHAKRNIGDAIEKNDINTSKWYAEKTMKEFNPKQEIEQTSVNVDIKDLTNMTAKDLEEIRAKLIK